MREQSQPQNENTLKPEGGAERGEDITKQVEEMIKKNCGLETLDTLKIDDNTTARLKEKIADFLNEVSKLSASNNFVIVIEKAGSNGIGFKQLKIKDGMKSLVLGSFRGEQKDVASGIVAARNLLEGMKFAKADPEQEEKFGYRMAD